ncbi:MAG: hypothetical protein HQL79_10190 [Magnetococcales bacterium]|nr:hypothetical protein [Magnetococcales bacterium]
MKSLEVNPQFLFSSPIKPESCAVLFGIPTCEEQFMVDWNSKVGKSGCFAEKCLKERNGKPDRHSYKRTFEMFFSQAEITVGQLELLGMTVEREGTLEQFRKLASRPENKVIVLFSHSHKERVEFRDGFYDAGAISLALPIYFNRMIDITVCHTPALANRLSADFLDSVIHHHLWKADPTFWLLSLELVAKLLRSGDCSYPSALTKAVKIVKNGLSKC